MDVKGQYECERLFMIFMWMATAISFGAGLALDDVRVMFGTFTSCLAVSTGICLPEWKIFNSNPLKFRPAASSLQGDSANEN
jgi:Microsomal signal peptidase 12 kDa subunit (SPC12)